MRIRALSSTDAAIFQPLRLRGLLESPTSFSSSHADEVDRPLSAVARALDPDSGRTTLGAFLDDVLVGVVGVGREAGTKERHRGFIRSMYVDASVRGRGIGRALMHECINVAASRPGLRQLALSVTATNAPAIALYRSLGFRLQGVVPEALYIDGAYLDEWFMILSMTRPAAGQSATVGWSRFAEQAPALAAAAGGLLVRNAVAFLATTTAAGRPRLHPFVPRVVDGRLVAFVLDSSPKIADLRRTGHYAIHLLPGPEDEEFCIRGVAIEINDEPALRTRAATAMAFATGVDDHHVLFEFRVDRALHTRWLDFGTENHRPQRQHWR